MKLRPWRRIGGLPTRLRPSMPHIGRRNVCAAVGAASPSGRRRGRSGPARSRPSPRGVRRRPRGYPEHRRVASTADAPAQAVLTQATTTAATCGPEPHPDSIRGRSTRDPRGISAHPTTRPELTRSAGLWGTPRGTGVTTHRIACASLRLRRRPAHAGRGQSGRVVGRLCMTEWGRTRGSGSPARRQRRSSTATGSPRGHGHARGGSGRWPRWRCRRHRRGGDGVPRAPGRSPARARGRDRAGTRTGSTPRACSPAATAWCPRRSSRPRWGGCWPVPVLDTPAELAAVDPPRRARVVAGPPRVAERERLRPQAAQLSLPLAALAGGAATADRAAQAPAQGGPAARAARILEAIPPHDAAHACGHSPVTHARRHAGRGVVLRFDLEDFLRIDRGRAACTACSAAPVPEVAADLTGLVTNACRWRRRGRATGGRPARRRGAPPPRRRLAAAHLPQGLHPALANNLCAYRLDCRLAGLADAFGATYAVRRRHSPLRRSRSTRRRRSCGARSRRSRSTRASGEPASQLGEPRRASVCGIVVNDRPNAARDDYDRLRRRCTRPRCCVGRPSRTAPPSPTCVHTCSAGSAGSRR